MTDTNNSENTTVPRSRVKKRSNSVLYLFIITIAALIGGFYFYQKNIVTLHQLEPSEPIKTITQNNVVEEVINREKLNNSQNELIVSPSSQPQVDEEKNSSPSNNQQLTESISIPLQSQETTQTIQIILNKESVENTDYSALINEMDSFYSHLDSQQYMRDFDLSDSSKQHFSKLIQKLIDNPPIVTRETDNLFTLLKNTAHFFRVIGKDNILILKGILDREKSSFETILQSFYQLTYKPEYLEKAYSITLDTDALYDYAGFFLHTMGGRLYLFRRDSNSRMAVSFYSILIIDRANNSGDSRHGIDIRPAIDSLIEEIENGGKNLYLRDSYLDTLYDLKEKYS